MTVQAFNDDLTNAMEKRPLLKWSTHKVTTELVRKWMACDTGEQIMELLVDHKQAAAMCDKEGAHVVFAGPSEQTKKHLLVQLLNASPIAIPTPVSGAGEML